MKVALLKNESFGKVLVAGVMAGLVTLAVSCKSTGKTTAAPAVAVPPPAIEPAVVPPPAPPAPAVVETVAPPTPAVADKEEDASSVITDGKGKKDTKTAKDKTVKPVVGKEKSHVVAKGDTLSKIAAKNGVTVAALAAANNMKSTDILRLGKKLEIPAAGAKATTPTHKAKKETVTEGKAPTAKKVATTKTTKKHTEKKDDTAKAEKASATAAPATAGGKYVVKNGDNPPKIAKNLHVKVSALLAANGLTAETAKKLKIGQELVIPAGGEAPAAAAPAGADAAPVCGTNTPAEKAEKTAAPAPAGEVAAPSAAAAGSFPHMVIEGDTLQGIADSYGVTVADIQKANPALKSDADLKPNTTIAIPTK